MSILQPLLAGGVVHRYDQATRQQLGARQGADLQLGVAVSDAEQDMYEKQMCAQQVAQQWQDVPLEEGEEEGKGMEEEET